jgi:hypothetical protein
MSQRLAPTLLKYALYIVAILGVTTACGSVSYYYLIFLPQQNAAVQQQSTAMQRDINAIRNVVVPTPEQRAATNRTMQEVQARIDAMHADDECRAKERAYEDSKCPKPNPNDINAFFLDSDCRQKAYVEAAAKFKCSF